MPYHNRKLSYQFIYELKPFEFDISDIWFYRTCNAKTKDKQITTEIQNI